MYDLPLNSGYLGDSQFCDPKAENAGKKMLRNFEKSLVQCPYCTRKFRRHALPKHIARNCNEVEEAIPGTGGKKIGAVRR